MSLVFKYLGPSSLKTSSDSVDSQIIQGLDEWLPIPPFAHKQVGQTWRFVANHWYLSRELPAPSLPAPIITPAITSLNHFKAAFGSLRGKHVFGDDAVRFQREMREEWE